MWIHVSLVFGAEGGSCYKKLSALILQSSEELSRLRGLACAPKQQGWSPKLQTDEAGGGPETTLPSAHCP